MINLTLVIVIASEYISPAIAHLNVESSYEEISQVISVYWLAGFIEAEGNFGIYPTI